MHQHRPGTLKQSNKPHKTGKHETRGAVKRKADGKIAALNTRAFVKDSSKQSSKLDRKNKGKQMIQKKKETVLANKRLGHSNSVPKVVGIIPLSAEASVQEVWDYLLTSCDEPKGNTSTSITLRVSAWKQRITLVRGPDNDTSSILDIGKVADIILLVLPASGADAKGEQYISMIKSQGMPTIIGLTQGLDKIPQKQRKNVKKDLGRYFSTQFLDEEKLLPLETAQDATQVLRYVTNVGVRHIQWRERRPYLLVDKLAFSPSSQDPTVGTLSLSGYLRGHSLDVNNLVHLPDFGDFQIQQIDGLPDPYPLNKHLGKVRTEGMETDQSDIGVQILATPNPELQETLKAENEPDFLNNEQTWPTEEEMQEAEDRIANKIKGERKKKRVPKGTSAYQAAWIIDSDDEQNLEDDEEDDDIDEEYNVKDDGTMLEENMEKDGGDHEEEEEEDDDEEYEDIDVNAPEGTTSKSETGSSHNGSSSHKGGEEEGMFNEEEINQLAQNQRVRLYERSADDMEFPDEVDVPEDVTARERFQKYRGLKSFRTSPWDPKENLPLDYAKTFQFANFQKTKKRVLGDDPSNISPNQYITIHLANAPRSISEKWDGSRIMIAGGLLKYEGKYSILNFNVMKHSSYVEPVQSKDPLVIHCGFRRYLTFPVFSENTLRSEKHKYERFLHPSRNTIATVYAPITFPTIPVLMLHPQNGQLVATGSLMSVDPDRIILKRIILTGYPLKIHKRYAVVREMFYNPEDVKWFKPVELHTKYGRTGHIKEPLGTHGYMKCVFDSQIQAHDTICLQLYKRVFPIWTHGVQEVKTTDNKARQERIMQLHNGYNSKLEIVDMEPINITTTHPVKPKKAKGYISKHGNKMIDAPMYDDGLDDDHYDYGHDMDEEADDDLDLNDLD